MKLILIPKKKAFFAIPLLLLFSPFFSSAQTPPSGAVIRYDFTAGSLTDLGSAGDNGSAQGGTLISVPDRHCVSGNADSLNSALSQYITQVNPINVSGFIDGVNGNVIPYSTSIWFKIYSTNTGTCGLMNLTNSQIVTPGSYDHTLFMSGGYLFYGTYNSTYGEQIVVSPSTYNDGNWHNVVVTMGSSDGTILYVDGVNVSGSTGSSITSTNSAGPNYWRLGYSYLYGWGPGSVADKNGASHGYPGGSTPYYFNGSIDDALLYNTELTPTQVANIYNVATASASATCAGSSTTVTVSSNTLPTGTYTVTYNVHGANTVASTTASMSFTSGTPGTGTFTTAAIGTTTGGTDSVNITNLTIGSCSQSLNYNTPGFTVNSLPAITAQPSTSAQTVCAGSSLTALTVTATGAGLTYQWYSNASNSNSGGTAVITGTGYTTATFTPSNSTASALYYYCVVSGTCTPAATSNTSGLITVNATSVGGTVSSAQSICSNSTLSSLTLSVNTGSVTKWQYSSDNFVSDSHDTAVTATTLMPPAFIGNRYYRAVVQSGVCASANSSSVLITVNAVPAAYTLSDTALIRYDFTAGSLTDLGKAGDNGSAQGGTPVIVADRFGVSGNADSLNAASSQYITQTTGIGSNGYIYGSTTNVVPYSASIWFKTYSSNTGTYGLMELTNYQTGTPSNYDHALFMSNGYLFFGIFNAGEQLIVSPTTYNDGKWHNAVVTMGSSDGTVLYVDGVNVTGTTGSSMTFTNSGVANYWRLGYAYINGWPTPVTDKNGISHSFANAAVSYYFNGSIDDAQLYKSELTTTEIAAIYYGATTASAATTCAGSGSTVTVSSNALATGTYTVTYNVHGANTVASTTATLNFTAGTPGTGTFTTAAIGTTTGGTDTVNITNFSNGTCSQPLNYNTPGFTVSSSSVAGTPSSAQTIFSGNAPANLNLNGNTGTVTKWQYSSDNFNTDIHDIASSSSATLTAVQMGPLTANRYYRAVVTSGACSAANSSPILIAVVTSAPGGTLGALLWLKADSKAYNTGTTAAANGQTIATWGDNTGLGNDVSQSTTAYMPTYSTASADQVNYNPTLKFNASNSQFLTNTNGIYRTNTYSAASAFVVTTTTTVQTSFIFTELQGTGGQVAIYTPWSDGNAYWDGANSSRINVPWGGTTGTPYIWTGFNNQTATPTNRKEIRRDGLVLASSTTAPVSYTGNNSALMVGSYYGMDYLNGNINELLIYASELSAAQRQQIESYLAIKYGKTLDQTTATNYLDASGSIIWNASTNTAYNNNIIGIGRDDSTALYQKQSHQLDDSTRIYLGTLNASNQGNSSTFSSDRQFVMIGNNLGSLSAYSSSNQFPSGQGIYSRIDREWEVTNTNFIGTFNMDVTLNTTPVLASNLAIVVGSSSNLSSGTLYHPTVTYSSGTVTITGITTSMVPANGTAYMTIVSMNSSTPLPLGLISFTAVAKSNSLVSLNWQVALEDSGAIFTVERSADGNQWKAIGTVSTAIQPGQYSFNDNAPLTGISYYRLGQTDAGGKYSLSAVRSVDIAANGSSALIIYPNPASDQVTVQGDMNAAAGFMIFDASGRNLTNNVKIVISGSSKAVINLAQLATGMYIIKCGNSAATVWKK